MTKEKPKETEPEKDINDFGQRSFVTWTAEDLRKEREAEKEIQMRKYRGLTKEGKWVYGWYLVSSEKHYIVDCHGVTSTAIALAHSIANFPGYHEVIPETVGQSIIVDGKEFYEGDVTKDDTGDIGVVRFGKLPLGKRGDCVCTYPAFYIQCFGQLGQATIFDCQEIGEWMEVIGTIHTTHPELME